MAITTASPAASPTRPERRMRSMARIAQGSFAATATCTPWVSHTTLKAQRQKLTPATMPAQKPSRSSRTSR